MTTKRSLEKIRLIGKGKFSQVYQVKDSRTGQILVLKVITKTLTSLQSILREVNILSTLFPECQSYFLCLNDFYEDADNYYLVSEYLSEYEPLKNTLHDVSQIEQFEIIINLVDGLVKLHQLGFVHHDIKPDNILVNSQGTQIKYIDFGMSESQDTILTNPKSLNIKGTPNFMSYEIVTRQAKTLWDFQQADIWALGMTIYQSIAGFTPLDRWFNINRDRFKHINICEIIKRFLKTYNFPIQRKSSMTPDEDKMFAFNQRLEKFTSKRLGKIISLRSMLDKNPIYRHLYINLEPPNLISTHTT